VNVHLDWTNLSPRHAHTLLLELLAFVLLQIRAIVSLYIGQYNDDAIYLLALFGATLGGDDSNQVVGGVSLFPCL
jgi:hypothetical protein